MSKTIIEIKNLKKNFEHRNGTIELFSGLNLKINKGDLVALVGPSGSGKSSFLHLLALLDDPSNGQIIFKNTNTKNFNDDQKNIMRSENISMIFQDNNLLSDFTALENVMMPLIIKGKNSGISETITVRRIVQGIDTERVVPLNSPNLVSIEQKRSSIVRRSKLYYMRKLTGKATRLKQRF